MRVGGDGEAEQEPGWDVACSEMTCQGWESGACNSSSMQRNPKATDRQEETQADASLGSLFQIIGTCLPQNLSMFGCPPKLTFFLAVL